MNKSPQKNTKDSVQAEALAYRYSTIFNSINAGIGVRDVNGALIDYNSKYLEAYGVDDIDAFLKLNSGINSDIIPESICHDYNNKKAGKHVIHYNYDTAKYKTNRTGIAIFEVTVAPMINDNNEHVGLVALINEVTEQYNYQKEIIEARANLNLALSAGGISAWIYDIHQDMFYTLHGNAIAGEGISREMNYKILHPEDVVMQQALFAALIKGEKSQEKAVFRYNINNNGYKHFESHMIVKKNEDGVVTHIMGTQKDLSDEIKKNKELKSNIRKSEYILSNINSALVYVDSNYNVIWGNVSDFFNIKKDEAFHPYAIGSICYKSLGKEAPCDDCLMQKALQSKKAETRQNHLSNGRVLEAIATPLSGDGDYDDGVILRITDITERSNLYSQLKESRNKAEETSNLMNAVFDKLPCLLFMKDITDNFRYVLANDYMCRASGVKLDNLIGNTDFDLFEPDTAQKFRDDDIAVVSSGGIFNYEEEVVWCGIRYVWQTSKYIVEAKNGHKMLIGLSLDMTEKVDAFREIEKEKNRAEEADRLKSAFLANMSHEIRTPLNAIVGFSELIQSTDDPEEKADYIQIINTNNELLLGLIGDILDLSKIEAGMIELIRAPFDLAPFFTEFATSLRQKVKNPNVAFIEINPYKKCIVTLDKNRLAQVFTNFATNAIKFTTKGYIKMGYEYIDGYIRLYVEDTGIGIPKDKHDFVFQRFEKLNNFTQGTGLGLSICEAIVNTSGGKIGFESQEGVGSTFWALIECEADIE